MRLVFCEAAQLKESSRLLEGLGFDTSVAASKAVTYLRPCIFNEDEDVEGQAALQLFWQHAHEGTMSPEVAEAAVSAYTVDKFESRCDVASRALLCASLRCTVDRCGCVKKFTESLMTTQVRGAHRE